MRPPPKIKARGVFVRTKEDRMKKGRNSDLVKKRNRDICRRFTYWYFVRKIRIDETLRILAEEEFYLTARHLWRIISEYKGLGTDEKKEDAIKFNKWRIKRGIGEE